MSNITVITGRRLFNAVKGAFKKEIKSTLWYITLGLFFTVLFAGQPPK